VGFLKSPADIDIDLLPSLLKNTLAPHFLQKPLLALVEEENHLRVFFDL
jgi:hypothetical protein